MKGTPNPRSMTNSSEFVVCGLDALGQYCVSALYKFQVKVTGIDLNPPTWQMPDMEHMFYRLIIGDYRYPSILQQAQVERCRSVLIVSHNERVNIEIAFAVRSLNPHARLVVRSSQENLNMLLGQELGNFTAFATDQLSAIAFALAASSKDMRGFFECDHQNLRVMQLCIPSTHPWSGRRLLHELHTWNRRILTHSTSTMPVTQTFNNWQSDTLVQAGDTLTWIEISDTELHRSSSQKTLSKPSPGQSFWYFCHPQFIGRGIQAIWNQVQQSQTQRVGLLSAGMMLGLLFIGTLLYKLYYPSLNFQDAINVSLVLAIGGYGDLFGQLQVPFPVPWWLRSFSITLSMAGTIFIGILYAILTEQLLSAKWSFLRRRKAVPHRDHVVVVGLGQIGQRVADVLINLRQTVVAMTEELMDDHNSKFVHMPLIVGTGKETLHQVNLSTAKGIVILTEDEVTNLEIGLMAHKINSQLNLVIGTFNPMFARNVDRLLPYATVLEVYQLTAEAFAAAAFGENVLNLFDLNDQTILITEYEIDDTDELNNWLLSDVGCGYGVVPILHGRKHQPSCILPSDDMRLQTGDRLIVLTTIDGLRRIEQGDRFHRQWVVHITHALNPTAVFEGGNAIARITGCGLEIARTVMASLPLTLDYPLYRPQAQRLVKALEKVQVLAECHSIHSES